MATNIQDLLRELVSYTVIETSHMDNIAKAGLSTMRKEFKRLETSNEPDKQARMIALFIGGTLFAVIHDDLKYKNNIFPKELAEKIYISGKTLSYEAIHAMYDSAPAMIRLGEQVLFNFPQSFNGEIFKAEANTNPPVPLFPLLKPHADKVDLLVKFCMKYKTNLERATMETDELVDSKAPNQAEDLSITEPASEPFSNSSMQVIGLFMTVLGAAAVAIAFVSLNATTFGLVGLLVAGLGIAALAGGVGFFAIGTQRKCQSPPVERDEEDPIDSFSI